MASRHKPFATGLEHRLAELTTQLTTGRRGGGDC
jgi:hypothetical protein